MKNDKSKNIIIALLMVIIIILIGLIVLFATDTIKFNSNSVNINNTQENGDNTNSIDETDNSGTNNIDSDNLEYNGEDVSDSEVEHISINRADSTDLDYDFNIIMTLSGKVKVIAIDENGNTSTDYLNNISSVIDIIHFSIPGVPNEQLVYILLTNGDVYYYKVGDSIDKKYTAIKVEDISKVKKLFIYSQSKSNAGGNWELIAITEENKFVSLNKQSV